MTQKNSENTATSSNRTLAYTAIGAMLFSAAMGILAVNQYKRANDTQEALENMTAVALKNYLVVKSYENAIHELAPIPLSEEQKQERKDAIACLSDTTKCGAAFQNFQKSMKLDQIQFTDLNGRP